MKSNSSLGVLQLVTGLGVGGAERVVVELSSEMVKSGYFVHVVSLNENVSLLKQYPDINFDYSALGIKKTIGSFFKSLHSIRQIVLQKNISVIHAHMFHSLLVAIAVKLFIPNLKVVFTSHNFGGFSWIRRVFIKWTRIMRSADIIFGQNQHNELNAQTTVIIKNSVKVLDVIKEGKVNGPVTTFLFLGRLEEQKNPLGLIKIFSGLENNNWKLFIAGDGYLKADVLDAILKHSLQDKVELLGIVSNVSALLNRIDCLVLPSLWEGLPMVLLEAGAHSLPVISTPVGSIPDLLSNDCGFISELDTFNKVLDFIIENPKIAYQRGKNLFEKVRSEYSLENMTKKHIAIYKKVING